MWYFISGVTEKIRQSMMVNDKNISINEFCDVKY